MKNKQNYKKSNNTFLKKNNMTVQNELTYLLLFLLTFIVLCGRSWGNRDRKKVHSHLAN